ncbi:hypothetical protein [Pseudomonas kribbensis]|uniref:Uncharacterized protein n=1 Tax=Pseudomonas kribbensis TaxID=1628086 RepID=A0A4Y8VH74_9PSED|nr:hypothetical protein [Pseudomonas kribbensis]TFH79837.1 hypothetical protein E4J90_14250 [Pseudomonas kribbensis]
MNFLNFFKRRKSAKSITETLPESEYTFPGNREQSRQDSAQSDITYSDTNQSLMRIWNEIGATLTTVEADTIFYSGIRSNSPIFNINELLATRGHLWLSQSASYAGEYCYTHSTPYSILAKFRVKKKMPVLEFPKSFHPADAFLEYVETASGFEVDYSSPAKFKWLENALPDHHINCYFRDIVGNGNFEIDPAGHARRAIKNELGALTGEILELFIADLDYIELLDLYTPPATKPEFLNLIGSDRANAANVLFT